MNSTTPAASAELLALLVFFVALVGVLVVMYGLSYILGQRHREKATNDVYESGIRTTGSARVRFSAKFYLVAMSFVIFDLEVAFIFAWAIAAMEVGWLGYGGLVVFVVILLVGLIYEWRTGAIDWAADEFRILRQGRKGG